MKRWILTPWYDVVHGADACLTQGLKGLLRLLGGLILGWWLYVPVHELFHAWGCLLAGGEVTELQIQARYGGSLLARVIPYVEPGGDYAGRLSGFSTGGNDLIYLATVLAPFVLTLFPGVWLIRRAAGARWGFWFGFGLPMALAPFLSVTGDAYEVGSILVTQVRPWSGSGVSDLLRGDDVLLKWDQVQGEGGVSAWSGYGIACLLGLMGSFLLYGAGSAVSRVLGRGAATPGRKG